MLSNVPPYLVDLLLDFHQQNCLVVVARGMMWALRDNHVKSVACSVRPSPFLHVWIREVVRATSRPAPSTHATCGGQA